jgi:hypothetical protein
VTVEAEDLTPTAAGRRLGHQAPERLGEVRRRQHAAAVHQLADQPPAGPQGDFDVVVGRGRQAGLPQLRRVVDSVARW